MKNAAAVKKDKSKLTRPSTAKGGSVKELAATRNMQDFFHQHGAYRVQDVQRVLGDPVKGITVDVGTDLVFSRTCK